MDNNLEIKYRCIFATFNKYAKKPMFNILILLVLSLTLASCSIFKSDENNKKAEDDGIIVPKKNTEINVLKKADDNALGKVLWGASKESSKINIMWEATLQTLGDIPLSVASYEGAVIQTDWYSENTNESIKIKIEFISKELKVSSIKVTSFKKICTTENSCKIINLNKDFNDQIKSKIIAKIKDIKSKQIN